MIKKRNEALVGRYYYWTEVQRLRFDDALRILSEREFFISEQRIMAIIRAVVSSSESAQRKPGKRIKKTKNNAGVNSICYKMHPNKEMIFKRLLSKEWAATGLVVAHSLCFECLWNFANLKKTFFAI